MCCNCLVACAEIIICVAKELELLIMFQWRTCKLNVVAKLFSLSGCEGHRKNLFPLNKLEKWEILKAERQG